MIPQRVKLKGFLCYKEEQAIDFEGSATLWMLAGLNGSGKSAIFDAVTFALFGHHRGGGTNNHELINKDSDGFVIEFDVWVRDHIGLTYETFTSSVLLLQGRAEKLLDSKPEGRREVLASIVDLERYERLHRLADERRKKLDGQLDLLRDR